MFEEDEWDSDVKQVHEKYSLIMACELRMFWNFRIKYD